ncbi:hypothetical protein PR202_gb22956 [Eleusine coracana subsp. coracana]|uniref:DUF1618 domain-containing protein n=1 Tax=Eleusine coracana subsp. coracana TaxID=191504 RepID=A0AAV5FH66_ELECO|nr:hypothetical protein PR202_gb22956 [Eleusine coracana subsp. coracana]
MEQLCQRLLSIPPPIDPVESPDSPPESILLDPSGYLSPRTNGTTAGGLRSSGKPILVTFWAASPPRVSCFTVHCPCDDPKLPVLRSVPKILCSDDDLVLLRLPTCPRPPDDDDGFTVRADENENDYFVYEAGTAENKPPSLMLVPTPSNCNVEFHDDQIVILRSDISETGRWSTRLMKVVGAPNYHRYRNSNKAIAIGGERCSVGWVDLWRGILVCDLLPLDNPDELRYVALPTPPTPKPEGDPTCSYVGLVALPGCVDTFQIKGWEAAKKTMKISSTMGSAANNNWEDNCAIRFSQVPVDSPTYAQMLPNLKPGDDGKITLKKLRGGYPALSLHDQDVVYIVNMPLLEEMQLPSVIALDMRNKAIKNVAYFGGTGRPIGYDFSYLQSGISRHLPIRSSTM